MIIVRANARNATYISDDLITSGSVGIPIEFALSDDYDGLSAIAVFEGSGVKRDVALMGNSCVVPHEVVATAGGYLRIGIYASNSEGTIVIPTVWAGSKMILQGAQPSEVDPSEPTPSWVAQVQAAAAEALETANNVLDMTVEADTLPAGSEASVEKTVDPDGAVTLTFGIPQGGQGNDGVSPTVDVTEITGGHQVSVTDAEGTETFDVMNGEPGADGFSPFARVEQTATGATVTVTDKTGTTTANLTNGEDGENGISPTITVTDITGGHRVTITDATGSHSFDVMDGDSADAPVQDVQVNGVSVLDAQGVANLPIANRSDLGLVKVVDTTGIAIASNGILMLNTATAVNIKSGGSATKPIAPYRQHESTYYGLSKAAGVDLANEEVTVGTYPDSAKSAISQMLNSPVTITGTTPSITALPGIRYVCGEVTTLDITLPASGIVDVVFTSGSTPAALTVTPPSGQTMKWANGWDGTCEANTTYEINVMDGVYGVVGAWT